jgi:hypothetical protein
MQGAITESSSEVNTAHSHLVKNGDTISLILQKDISKANKITASIAYDNESLSLSQPESTLGTITVQNEDYSDTLQLTLSVSKDITKGTVLAMWKITKSLPEIHTINLSDVQIESTE